MRATVSSLSKRLLSIFFAATLVLGLVPAAAFADESFEPSTGDVDGSNSVADASASAAEEEPIENDATVGDDSNLGASMPAGDVINQTMPLDTVAQAESTRSYFLAQTLESTKTVPVVSAKLPLDSSGANQGAQAGADGGQIAVGSEDKVTDGDLPAASTEAGAEDEPEGGEDSDESDLEGAVTLPGVAVESTVVGSFTYLGMTFAVEPGGESVALVAVDYSKLPEEFIQKQVIVVPDMATPDELDYYSVTRIADNAFASLTKETANPDHTGCIELFSDEELLAEAGISQEEVQEFLDAEPVENDSIESSDDIRTIVSMDGNVATLDDGSTYAFTNPLAGCTGILALGIPASVSTIEDDAISGFETLQYLVVSDDNPEFASYDGALYSADLTNLRLIPEGRVGAVRVASSATSADPEVFSHCPSVDALVADAEGGICRLLFGDGEAHKNASSRESVQLVFSGDEAQSCSTLNLGYLLKESFMIENGLSNTGIAKMEERIFERAASGYPSDVIITNGSSTRTIYFAFERNVVTTGTTRPVPDLPSVWKCTNSLGPNESVSLRVGNGVENRDYAQELLYDATYGLWGWYTYTSGSNTLRRSATLAVSLTEGAMGVPVTELLDSTRSAISHGALSYSAEYIIGGIGGVNILNYKTEWDAGAYGGSINRIPEQDETINPENTILVRHVPQNDGDNNGYENLTSVVEADQLSVPAGFTFKGWATQAETDSLGNRTFNTKYKRWVDGTEEVFTCTNGGYLGYNGNPGDNLIIEEDTTFYAVFETELAFDASAYGGKVQAYDDEGNPVEGSFVGSTVLRGVRYGDKIAVPQVEEKGEGWTFQGWASRDEEGNLGERSMPDSFAPTSDETLYAVWGVDVTWQVDDEAAADSVVIGSPGSGSSYVQSDVLYGTKPLGSVPNVSARRGYAFSGWRSSADGALYGGAKGASSVPSVHGPTTFTTEWEAIDYSIALDVAGGYEDGYDGWSPDAFRVRANIDEEVRLPNGWSAYPVPARYGYAFEGWFEEEGGRGKRFAETDGTPVEGAVWTEAADGTLYAAWSPKSYPVRWMFNFTEADEPEAFYETNQTYDAPLMLPSEEAPARPGFASFDGWFEDRAGRIQVEGGTTFAPQGLEDRYGEPQGGNVTCYYASYSGAESYWVKLLAGEGGRFATDDTAFMPEDFRYAYSQNGATPVPVIVAGEEQEVELVPSAQHLNARLADYAFAGWQEVEGTWADNGENYRSIADTAPGSVYGTDTVLPDGQVRLAGTLVDDTIPAKVMGNRTLRAVWRSEGAKIVLELGRTGMEGTDGVEGPAFAKEVCERLGFSPNGDGMALLWESPYASLDLSSIAVCEGYRLVGFAREGNETGEALLSIEASRNEPASAWAGTYIAIWEPLDYEIVFHANHAHDGASSAYDLTLRCSFDATLVLPAPTSFPHLEDGGYGSYALKWWGARPLETSSAHSAWRADAQVPFCEILSEAGEDEERTVHLYAQWVAPVSVTIPLFVNLAVDPDQDWAEVIVADWDRTDEDDGTFLGIQSRTRALFKVHSITCDVVNELIGDDGGAVPLVSAADGGPLPKERMYLTVSSGRDDADGTELAFDLGEERSRFIDGASTLANGSIFDATSAGFAVSERDATRYTRIPLRFGLRFAEGYDITDFRFADLVADDPDSNGALARVFYTIEAL